MNINRDYLIINDVKKSNITLDNGSMFFYITDKNTQNIFVNLVINVSNNELIQKYANIENAEDYTLTMNIIKPNNVCKIIEGKLHDKEKGIFEFNLKKDCCDVVGTYKCELLTKCNINEQEEITTSNSITYIVKKSILNDLDDIVEAPEYPVVIQLLDKLSDIEQYEEDRRANELARQLAEEQRQARFNTLDADMTNSIQVIDNKVVDVENRIASKEQAVDKLITDTKADIDEYKVAKDQEIDDYKATKDAEINTAITAQDNKIDTAISNQNDRITVVENNDVAQNNRLDVLENKDVLHESRLDAIEAKNVEQDNRLNDIEAIDVAQNTRLDAIEAKNQQQDDRLLDIEKVNKRQDIDLKCLFTEAKNNMIDITEEGNSIYLQNSTTGYTLVDEIKGNTLVNCNKEPDKELILNGNINTSGDNTVTIAEGVDGGLVDVALEGNTLVNVSKTKDSIGITKAYTVENSGNHIALQGDIDGSCRPVVTGNTLVNLITYSNLVTRPANTNGATALGGADLKGGVTYTISYELAQTSTSADNGFGYYPNGTTFWYGHNNTITTLNNTVGRKTYTFKLPEDKGGYCKFRWWTNTCSVDVIVKDFILLEGDYTDKPIPDYFEGLQSSFEDNLVTQEMVDNGEEVADNLGKYKVEYRVTGKNKFDIDKAKVTGDILDKGSNYIIVNHSTIDMSYCCDFNPNCQYTLSWELEKIENNYMAGFEFAYTDGTKDFCVNSINCKLTSNPGKTISSIRITFDNNGKTKLSNIQLEEGDTATSYEPYKENTKTLYLNSPLLEGDTIEEKDNGIYHVHRYSEVVFDGSDDEKWNLTSNPSTNTTRFRINVVPTCYGNLSGYCDKFNVLANTNPIDMESIYLGNAFTIRILNSKLQTQDVAGFKQWLQQNPTTVVYKLTEPTYELIEQSNLVIPSYANGHLDFDTAVPVEKAKFKSFEEELTYLYANTQYTVQFVADSATTANITLGGTKLLAQSIVAGLNRISITTPSKLVDNKLVISGVGANISEVVVTDTDREFGYFEGMKSVGECEELEIKSGNKNLFDTQSVVNKYSNKVTIIDNGIQVDNGIYELKDVININPNKQYTLSWNCEKVSGEGTSGLEVVYADGGSNYRVGEGKRILTSDKDRTINFIRITYSTDGVTNLTNIQLEEGSTATDYISHQSNTQQLTHEPLRAVGDVKDRYVLIDGKWYIERNCGIRAYQEGDKDNYKTDLVNTVYPLDTPTYEPIDYNPLGVYSDVTHISTNSTIPTNMVIKNHGFNCLLKPSTTYTVSSNLGLNTVTTPSTLTEDCLRFMDTDTSDVTTMKDVLVLEGDWTTKADLIPTNFSGIESAFEQEYDAEKGKYKVNVKVANEDKTKENNITFYINEPLRGIGDTKDRVYVKDDKVVVERNCGNYTFNGSADEKWEIYRNKNEYKTIHFKSKLIENMLRPNTNNAWGNNICLSNIFSTERHYVMYRGEDRQFLTISNSIHEGIAISINKNKLQAQDVAGFKQWLQQNPVTVVYQLAEPTYEEVEYNDTKLFIESFKNSTLSYNSNVPVTSKLYYSYSVPIVDTVAQTTSISDQQDSMIIDLATQVAVMEMMLM